MSAQEVLDGRLVLGPSCANATPDQPSYMPVLLFLAETFVRVPRTNDTLPGTAKSDAEKRVLLSTQLVVSTAIGLFAFLAFCFLRTRWTTVFAPRTKLKGYAPEPLTATFFGWIPELLRIRDMDVLDKVGLDAAVYLGFFKMSLKLFVFCGIVAGTIRVPLWIFLRYNKGGARPSIPDLPPGIPEVPGMPHEPSKPQGGHIGIPFPDNPIELPDDESNEPYLIVLSYALFTWIFSFAVYYFMFHNYRIFTMVRQKYYLKLIDSIVARTIMVTSIPKELQTDKKLAEYYESLGIGVVESAVICRHVRRLKHALHDRTAALKKLEAAYTEWLGDPCIIEGYDPEKLLHEVENPAPNVSEDPEDPDQLTQSLIERYDHERPTKRTGLCRAKVDEINYYAKQFHKFDRLVRAGRRASYLTTSTGFVTFETMASAQIAAQTLSFPRPNYCKAVLAPEPRDIYWENINLHGREVIFRQMFVGLILVVLIFFWSIPVSGIASLLSMDTIEAYLPWLARLAERNEIVKGLIQGTLPTLAVTGFNAILPKIMDFLSRLQGLQARSYIQLSTLSKYFFFLLWNVFLVFTIVGTLSKSLEDIVTEPTKIAHILAETLPTVSPFFINFVILQGIALFPIELLQVKEIIPAYISRAWLSSTPRDYAEASAPPFLRYGEVCPQVVLVFILVLVYSTISPSILFFGTIYFCIGFFCYKYLLLYVYFHPYESAGQAWPLIFRRIIIGIYIYQLLMIGFLLLRRDWFLAMSLVPLLVITTIFGFYVNSAFSQFTTSIPVSLIREEENTRKKRNEADSTQPNSDTQPNSSTQQHSPLPLRAYTFGDGNDPFADAPMLRIHRSMADDELYHATPDLYTDFSQPPMTLYPGVLNTGMKRYGPPALIGTLPWLWLPVKRTQEDIDNVPGFWRGLLGMHKKGDDDPLDENDEEEATERTRLIDRFRRRFHRDSRNSNLKSQQAADNRIMVEQTATDSDPTNPNRKYVHHPERPVRQDVPGTLEPSVNSDMTQPEPESSTTTERQVPPPTPTVEAQRQPLQRAPPTRKFTEMLGDWAGNNFGEQPETEGGNDEQQ